jgi:AraC-like DNA-binding protein
MKACLHKLPLDKGSSFLFNKWNCNYFDKPWHFHEEYELVLIDKSSGTQLIGDKVKLFNDGDLFLIGPNIPHMFKNFEEYYQQGNQKDATSMFLHFTSDFLGKNFINLPEMTNVQKLFRKAAFALEIHGHTKARIIRLLKIMEDQSASRRMLSLLTILIDLSESEEIEPLLSTKFNLNTKDVKDSSRINQILEFITKTYQHKIYISEAASLVNMSDAAFSRYFKKHTQITFSQYVIEIRISQACQLIIQGEENITQVGFLCGFDNLSNFYRHFKKVTGYIPKDYQKKFQEVSATI